MTDESKRVVGARQRRFDLDPSQKAPGLCSKCKARPWDAKNDAFICEKCFKEMCAGLKLPTQQLSLEELVADLPAKPIIAEVLCNECRMRPATFDMFGKPAVAGTGDPIDMICNPAVAGTGDLCDVCNARREDRIRQMVYRKMSMSRIERILSRPIWRVIKWVVVIAAIVYFANAWLAR